MGQKTFVKIKLQIVRVIFQEKKGEDGTLDLFSYAHRKHLPAR